MSSLSHNWPTVALAVPLLIAWSVITYVCVRERRRASRLGSFLVTPLNVIILICATHILVYLYYLFLTTDLASSAWPGADMLKADLSLLVLGVGIVLLVPTLLILYILTSRWLPTLGQEIRRQEETTRQSAFYKGVFDSMRDVVSVHDTDLRIIALNAAGLQSLGVTESDVLGRKCFEAYHGRTEPCANCPVLRVFHTKQPSQARLEAPAGGEHVDLSAYPVLDEQGELLAVIEVARFVSEQLRLEQGRAEVDTMKRRLLALASHEMRTPLTLISGYAEELAERADTTSPKEVKLQARVIASEAARLSEMVRDILETSRIEDGELALERKEVDLAAVCREAAREVESEQNGRPVEIAAPEDLPRPLGDSHKLRQVVRNLLENAYKYSPEDARVKVALSHRDGAVEVAVTDHGIGIPQPELDRVFEMFHRVRNHDGRRVWGTGLGLYIARRIVEAHGGRIWAESTLNVGSVFRFTVPVQAVSQQQER
jgi:signal transduction histidine kinase